MKTIEEKLFICTKNMIDKDLQSAVYSEKIDEIIVSNGLFNLSVELTRKGEIRIIFLI